MPVARPGAVPPVSPLRERVIFNVGSRRSGTYWLQRIVTAHPSVGAVPSETHLFSHGIAPLMERFHSEDRLAADVGRIYADRARVIEAIRILCDGVLGEYLEAGQERVAERTPLHVFHLSLINEVYPDAQFVHIIRDGRDSARSIAAQPWGPESIADAAAEWRDAILAARGAALPADRYREVRYEALLADPEHEFAQLYEWLRLPNADTDLAHALEESRRRANVDQHGIGGVATAKWRDAFSADELREFNEVAGDLLVELGYSVEETSSDRLRPWRRAPS